MESGKCESLQPLTVLDFNQKMSSFSFEEIQTYFLENKLSLELTDKKKRNILHFACQQGRVDLAAWLLAQEADLHQADWTGKFPVHYAVIEEKKDILLKFFEHDSDIFVENCQTKETVLHYAV